MNWYIYPLYPFLFATGFVIGLFLYPPVLYLPIDGLEPVDRRIIEMVKNQV